MNKNNYYNEIKQKLIDNEITKKVKDYSKNKSDLTTYYNVGKLLTLAGKHYGDGIINDYSNRLTKDMGKGYTPMRLKYMRRFYTFFSKSPTLSDTLSYSHYCEIIWFDDLNKINYYVMISEQLHLSVRELRIRIKNKEYERLPGDTKHKLIFKEKSEIQDFIKNPIVIHNPNNIEVITEKVLHKLILEDMPNFLKELGEGFSFIDSEYKIKYEDTYNYIDLLLHNYIYNCFVVVELKVTELKKEHVGQLLTYMNYVDKNLKMSTQNKTIGIILTKRNNKFVIEYTTDSRIQCKEYQLIK